MCAIQWKNKQIYISLSNRPIINLAIIFYLSFWKGHILVTRIGNLTMPSRAKWRIQWSKISAADYRNWSRCAKTKPLILLLCWGGKVAHTIYESNQIWLLTTNCWTKRHPGLDRNLTNNFFTLPDSFTSVDWEETNTKCQMISPKQVTGVQSTLSHSK